MNFTTRLNKILKASGITVEATWCNVVKSYTVWCGYSNGYEARELCLEGVGRESVRSRTMTADEKAQSAALSIIERVLEWESR